jgi:hypothetical protein
VNSFGLNGKGEANRLWQTRIPSEIVAGRLAGDALFRCSQIFFCFGGNNFCATQFGCVQDLCLQAVVLHRFVTASRI